MASPKISQKEEKKRKSTQKDDALNYQKGLLQEIIVKPYVSEKALELEKERKYVFEVIKNANKKQVKDAVEELYQVSVVNINIINMPRKKKRLGRYTGWKKGYKKAIVELKENQKIDITTN